MTMGREDADDRERRVRRAVEPTDRGVRSREGCPACAKRVERTAARLECERAKHGLGPAGIAADVLFLIDGPRAAALARLASREERSIPAMLRALALGALAAHVNDDDANQSHRGHGRTNR